MIVLHPKQSYTLISMKRKMGGQDGMKMNQKR